MRIFFLRASFILNLMALTLGACRSFGATYDNFPANVHQSYAWGITDNKALGRDDLKKMAQTILMRNHQMSPAEAALHANQLLHTELRQISTEPFLIDYVEIPAEDFQHVAHFTTGQSRFLTDTDAPSPLRFQKDGREYVRWFFHPLRDPGPLLKRLGNPPLLKGKFLAQQTESRSVLVMDRQTGDYWSLKLSLPTANGPFKQKVFTAQDAKVQFESSEFLLAEKQRGVLADTQFMHEQEYVGLQMDQFSEAQMARNISFLKDGSYFLLYAATYSNGLHHYAPGADETRWLSDEPAKAAAILSDAEAAYLNSNHSQNSGLILSPDMIPQKYIRRDLDLDLDNQMKPDSDLASILPTSDQFNFNVNFSMTNGFDDRPLAYSPQQVDAIAERFFTTFAMTYLQLKRKTSAPKDVKNYITRDSLHYQFDPGFLFGSSPKRCELLFH